MNILLEQNKEIQTELERTQKLLDNKKLSKPLIAKITILNDKLLDISSTLTKLNIDIKLDNKIILNESELDYLNTEKESNKLIAKIMPALAVLSLTENFML